MTDIFEHKRGLIATVIAHAIAIVLLMFFGLRTPLPLPEEQGILVNFGTDLQGTGTVEPLQNVSPPREEKTQPAEKKEGVLTQDFEEAPVIEKKQETKKPVQKKTETKPQVKQEVKEPVKEEPKLNPRALYTGRKTSGEPSTSEGEGLYKGNQGVPEGSPDATTHGQGSGTGTGGIQFSLSGRSYLSLPTPEYKYQVEGTVVVEILVDREGNVISATPGVKGSTTLNENLLQAARNAAMKAKFNRKPDAPATQKGTITYHFLLQ